MATLPVRDLKETTKRNLRLLASRHGRTVEAETRAILEAAVAAADKGPWPRQPRDRPGATPARTAGAADEAADAPRSTPPTTALRRALVVRAADVPPDRTAHGAYEYDKRLIVPRRGNQCTVALMEVPPGKSAYPYHYHAAVTEVFFVLEGSGRLRTPEGIVTVDPGDVAVFPPGPAGAHQLTNASDTQVLRYVDFDTTAPADAPFYPDSGKVSVIVDGMTTGPFRLDSQVDYYDGE